MGASTNSYVRATLEGRTDDAAMFQMMANLHHQQVTDSMDDYHMCVLQAIHDRATRDLSPARPPDAYPPPEPPPSGNKFWPWLFGRDHRDRDQRDRDRGQQRDKGGRDRDGRNQGQGKGKGQGGQERCHTNPITGKLDCGEN
jgi:hypothetical protein